MSYSVVTCSNCNKVIEYGASGYTEAKYGPHIGKTTFERKCYNCGATFQIEGEWDYFSSDTKFKYVLKQLYWIGFGIAALWVSPSIGEKQDLISIAINLLVVIIFVYAVCNALNNLYKIKQSIERTR